MSPKDLPSAYLKKSKSRLKALRVLLDEESFSDVVRDAQAIVELCSKGILRLFLIDPPHLHDVANELLQIRQQFDPQAQKQLDDLVIGNHWLRREREMAFYGADDFDPTEGYSLQDARRAFAFAEQAISLLERFHKERSG